MKKIKLKMEITSAVIAAVVIACVIILNSLVALVGDKVSLSVDLTRDKIYVFSEQTKSVMKELDAEINAYCLIPDGTEDEYVDYIKAYLEKYKTLSDKFNVQYIDPYKNPMFMQKYNDGENQANIGSVIIENGDKFRVITFEQLYTRNSLTNAIQIDMERKVTNAVMSVTGKLATSNIYFTQGHNEVDAQYLKALLSNEGYTCNTFSISLDGIPEDADIIFSVLPVVDYTEDERNQLDMFMDKGGKFVLVADLQMPLMENLDSYLDEWGIKLNRDFVIETDGSSALSAGTGLPMPAAKLQEHVITQKLMDSKIPLPMPGATSFSVYKAKNGAVTNKLLMTSEKAYGKTNLASNTVEKEDGDIEGPLCMSAISEKIGDNPSSVMVIGSAYAVLDTLVLESSYLNGDFVLNSINYLSGSNAAATIRAKQVSPEIMTMSENEVRTTIIIIQYILPLAIVAIGLFVWLRRRFK